MAYLSKDHRLFKAFDAGYNIHSNTASEIFGTH